MHQYCSYNIFTIPKCHKGVYGGNSGSNCIYSGVGIHEGNDHYLPSSSSCMTGFLIKIIVVDGEKIYHSYYKWAPVVILFQAISFYAPHRLWKSFESGKVFELTTYLRDSMLDPEVLNEQKKRATWVAEFLHKTLYRQRLFYMVYVFCQLLSVLNILGNIYFTNWYLQGVFFRYGWDSINLLNDNPFETYNPMHEVTIRIWWTNRNRSSNNHIFHTGVSFRNQMYFLRLRAIRNSAKVWCTVPVTLESCPWEVLYYLLVLADHSIPSVCHYFCLPTGRAVFACSASFPIA